MVVRVPGGAVTAMVESLITGLAARWPLLVLAMLPAALLLAVSTVFHTLQKRLAGADPRELPEAAGPWVRAAADRHGLTDLRIEISPAFTASLDALIPSLRTLVLQPRTWEQRDPVGWAVAAHELGHALHVRHPAWSVAFTVGRTAAHALGQLVIAGLITILLVGSPTATVATGVLLGGALLSQAVVLVDEGWASRTAWDLLVQDGRLDAGQLARARWSLLAAFGAHLAATVGLLATAVLWPWMVAPVDGPLLPGLPPLPWPLLIIVAALTLPLVKRALRVGIRALTPHRAETLTEVGARVLKEAFGDQAGGLGALAMGAVALTQIGRAHV
jgi:Zn-dependent membrane protease YugP